MISNDTDNFVKYSRYNGKYTVTKGIYTGYSDSASLYRQEISFQEMLSEHDLAPRLLQKGKKIIIKKRAFITWTSEDAGLPIQECDIPEANKVLDTLYDMGIVLTWDLHQSRFVKGFDGKIRVTDFKHTEKHINPTRVYLQWRVF